MKRSIDKLCSKVYKLNKDESKDIWYYTYLKFSESFIRLLYLHYKREQTYQALSLNMISADNKAEISDNTLSTIPHELTYTPCKLTADDIFTDTEAMYFPVYPVGMMFSQYDRTSHRSLLEHANLKTTNRINPDGGNMLYNKENGLISDMHQPYKAKDVPVFILKKDGSCYAIKENVNYLYDYIKFALFQIEEYLYKDYNLIADTYKFKEYLSYPENTGITMFDDLRRTATFFHDVNTIIRLMHQHKDDKFFYEIMFASLYTSVFKYRPLTMKRELLIYRYATDNLVLDMNTEVTCNTKHVRKDEEFDTELAKLKQVPMYYFDNDSFSPKYTKKRISTADILNRILKNNNLKDLKIHLKEYKTSEYCLLNIQCSTDKYSDSAVGFVHRDDVQEFFNIFYSLSRI